MGTLERPPCDFLGSLLAAKSLRSPVLGQEAVALARAASTPEPAAASADDGATDEEDAPAPREEAATELDGRGVGAVAGAVA